MDIRSNEPFWLIKNGLMHTYPSLTEEKQCQILIVGSGITGALMAHALISNGYDTILIDKREVCHGSTSATTSMLQYEIDFPLIKLAEKIGFDGAKLCYKACLESILTLEKIIDQIKADCDFTRKKSLYFAENKKDLKWLRQEFEARQEAGFNVEWLETEELWQGFGLKAKAGILSTDGASVDAFRLAHELLSYNTKKGLQVFDRSELANVSYAADKVFAYVNDGIKITADHIVYCNGYEAQNMLPDNVVKLKSTYAIVSECNDNIKNTVSETLFWNTDSPYLYWRTTSDNRILIGGEDENFVNASKRDRLLKSKKKKLLKSINDLLPNEKFIADFSWCGTFGETRDALPYIGAHPDFPRSYFVLGFGGNGITFSVMGMEIIPDLITEKTNSLSEYFRFGR